MNGDRREVLDIADVRVLGPLLIPPEAVQTHSEAVIRSDRERENDDIEKLRRRIRLDLKIKERSLRDSSTDILQELIADELIRESLTMVLLEKEEEERQIPEDALKMLCDLIEDNLLTAQCDVFILQDRTILPIQRAIRRFIAAKH